MVYDVAVKPEHRDRVSIADFMLNERDFEAVAQDPEELYGRLRAALIGQAAAGPSEPDG